MGRRSQPAIKVRVESDVLQQFKDLVGKNETSMQAVLEKKIEEYLVKHRFEKY